jgi:hypothetical protein
MDARMIRNVGATLVAGALAKFAVDFALAALAVGVVLMCCRWRWRTGC